ncbi:SO2930 family diheme c-type cytochrome [Leptospira gomenensis]|nr:SO2930 family diheme c-type cytochrome [Leptospira gomenensis]
MIARFVKRSLSITIIPLCMIVFLFFGCKENNSADLTPLAILGLGNSQSATVKQKLSEYGLLHVVGDGTLEVGGNSIAYDLNTPLFSDYALKYRTVTLPEGESGSYDPSLIFSLPVGTILTKTFSLPEDFRLPNDNIRIVETRVLIHTETGWRGLPYVWNEAGTDADYRPGGKVEAISFIDANGATQNANYLLPSENQCRMCHETIDSGGSKKIVPIGLKARHLNKTSTLSSGANQLDVLKLRNFLTGVPASATAPRAPNAFDVATGTLEERARAYLDINCAHCHNPNAQSGITSQLFLNVENANTVHLGYCKIPGSAGQGNGGFTYDIVPGDADHSILKFRLETANAAAMMPALGRSLVHTEGVQLIKDWIDSLTPVVCN